MVTNFYDSSMDGTVQDRITDSNRSQIMNLPPLCYNGSTTLFATYYNVSRESVTNSMSTGQDLSIESHLVTMTYAIVAITGMVTNMVILGLILCRRNLRTGSNLLILNLAVSDILMAALSPVTLAALVNRSWLYGSALCKLVPFVQGIEIFVSSLTVTAIAIDRMLLITDSAVGQWRPGITNKSLGCTTCAIWILALTLSSPVIVSYQVETIGDPAIFEFDKCLESRNQSYLIVYTMIILIAQFLVPTVALVTSYAMITRYLNKQSVSRDTLKISRTRKVTSGSDNMVNGSPMTENSRSTPITDDRVSPGPPGENRGRSVSEISHGRDYHRNRRAILTLMAIWLCFVISWSPWNFLQVYIELLPNFDLSPSQFNRLFVTCHLMAMSSTITNGILYGFFNTNVRTELNLIRSKMTCYRPDPISV